MSRACQPGDGTRSASIIPVSNITQSIHLIPLVGNTIPCEWSTGAIVLEECHTFLVNSFINLPTYLLFNQ